MEEEQALDGTDKSFTRGWKFLKGAFKRLEPRSKKTSLSSSHGSTTEGTRDAPSESRSSSISVKQRLTKGPLGSLYKPKLFKVPSEKVLLEEVGHREGSQFEMMLDRALSLKRHDSMDLMWRSGDLGLFGGNTQSASEEDDQVRELIHTERLIVKRASGRAIVNKQYLVIKTLGSGQYGKVQLVVNVADLQPYAIKTVSKAKLRTSIRRIRSSLSRHSYSNLNMAASQAVASLHSTAGPDPSPEPERAPPPPTDSDSSPSLSSAASSAPSSPFVGMPNLPGSELFTSAPPNSRFGGRSKKELQPVAERSAAPSSSTTANGEGAAPSSSGAHTDGPEQSKVASPFAAACGRSKVVSPFAAAAKASLQAMSQDSPAEAPAAPGTAPPRLKSSLGLSPLDMESTSLGISFGRAASSKSGSGEMSPSVTPRQSLAERNMPRPSIERISQLRGYAAPAESEPDSNSYSPRSSLAERPVPRPSLEHIAHLRGFARANSTPNTGLADSFSLTRSASIRTTPRAADVVQEIAVMKKLNHPNIVRLYEVIDDPSTDSLLLVMEHVDGGSLEQPYDPVSKTWESLPESLVHRHFRELCKGLDYLHYNKALHGDLKPANLLLSSERLVKIADFGSAMMYQESEGTWEGPVNGTPAFRPPETLTAFGKLTRKVDVWAAGVCLYVWVWGCLPFQGDSIPDMFTAIKEKPLTFPSHPDCHPHLKDLITKILTKQPEERLSLHEVMQHPWVTQNGTSPLPTVAASGLQTVHVTSLDVSSAISSQNRPSVPALQSIFKEVSFSAGEMLGSGGAEGACIYLIAQGQVDVLRNPASSSVSEVADADDDIADDPPCEMSGKSVTELVSNLRRPFEGEDHVWLATRGPGEFVGLHNLAKGKISRQTTDSEQSEASSTTVIKARTNVSAFQASKEAVAAAMCQHPELADTLQSKVIQHMADQTVAEAIGALHMGQMTMAS